MASCMELPEATITNWERAREVELAVALYKLGLARERGGLCGEFAQKVKLAMEREFGSNGLELPRISYTELGTNAKELDEPIEIGRQKTAANLAILRASRPTVAE